MILDLPWTLFFTTERRHTASLFKSQNEKTKGGGRKSEIRISGLAAGVSSPSHSAATPADLLLASACTHATTSP